LIHVHFRHAAIPGECQDAAASDEAESLRGGNPEASAGILEQSGDVGSDQAFRRTQGLLESAFPELLQSGGGRGPETTAGGLEQGADRAGQAIAPGKLLDPAIADAIKRVAAGSPHGPAGRLVQEMDSAPEAPLVRGAG